MDVHAVLDASICVSLLLCVRIFSLTSMASKLPVQPSGLVPGWNWGGASAVLQAIGGSKDLIAWKQSLLGI
jgi:hypothetical protein